MQFITSGNRIAVENFTVGYLYTITFTNGDYIHTACTGIGIDFVMFTRVQPDYMFALTMDTAVTVSTIDIYSEGGGTANYNDLTNKPQINSVELVGNKTLNDLGIQPVINAEHMLSYTLVSGLGTAATTDTSDYATAAQGALADTAVQPTALNDYQTLIDNDNKLSADLVDDTSTTNKFATSAQLDQIETNKNNILSITPTITTVEHTATQTTDYEQVVGLTYTLAAGKTANFSVSAINQRGAIRGIKIATGTTLSDANTVAISETSANYRALTCGGIYTNTGSSDVTLYVFVKFYSAVKNAVTLSAYQV